MKIIDITKFIISDKRYLKISHDTYSIENLSEIEECLVCTYIDIAYVDEKTGINISFGCCDTGSFICKMATSELLTKLLEGNAVYDKAVNRDLGFLFNQYSEGLLHPFPEYEYHFMDNAYKQTGVGFDSWLYNDKDGNIIFEITPFYPWNSKTLRKDPQRISYKKFMKDYKPILETVIPKESIQQWIQQGQELNKLWFPESKTNNCEK